MVSGPFCAPLGIEWTGGGKSRRRSRQQNVLVFACVRPHLLHSLAGMTDCGSHGCSCDRCSAQCAAHHSHVGQRLVRAPVVPRGMQVAALGSLLHAHVHYQGVTQSYRWWKRDRIPSLSNIRIEQGGLGMFLILFCLKSAPAEYVCRVLVVRIEAR